MQLIRTHLTHVSYKVFGKTLDFRLPCTLVTTRLLRLPRREHLYSARGLPTAVDFFLFPLVRIRVQGADIL